MQLRILKNNQINPFSGLWGKMQCKTAGWQGNLSHPVVLSFLSAEYQYDTACGKKCGE